VGGSGTPLLICVLLNVNLRTLGCNKQERHNFTPGAGLHSALHDVLQFLTTACAQEEEDKRAKQGEAHIVARTAKAKKAELSDLERMLARCARLPGVSLGNHTDLQIGWEAAWALACVPTCSSASWPVASPDCHGTSTTTCILERTLVQCAWLPSAAPGSHLLRKLTRLLSRHYAPQPCGCRLEEVRREAQDAELRAAQLADEVRAASEALADRMGAYQETATQFFSCAAPMGYPQGG